MFNKWIVAGKKFQGHMISGLSCSYTVNWEIFVYENIHVLNIRVNKFSRVPHENILTRKFAVKSVQCVTHCNWR